tara:strand:- start:1047 stop:1376 length:330 start_codon:yes stop_codon:yes gene_type:complete
MTKQEEEFRSSQELRASLSQILQNPTLQRALSVIITAPDEFPPTPPNVHTDVHYSREYAKAVGTNNAIKRLHQLTEALVIVDHSKSPALRPEWADNLPKDMQEQLAKLQ